MKILDLLQIIKSNQNIEVKLYCDYIYFGDAKYYDKFNYEVDLLYSKNKIINEETLVIECIQSKED